MPAEPPMPSAPMPPAQGELPDEERNPLLQECREAVDAMIDYGMRLLNAPDADEASLPPLVWTIGHDGGQALGVGHPEGPEQSHEEMADAIIASKRGMARLAVGMVDAVLRSSPGGEVLEDALMLSIHHALLPEPARQMVAPYRPARDGAPAQTTAEPWIIGYLPNLLLDPQDSRGIPQG